MQALVLGLLVALVLNPLKMTLRRKLHLRSPAASFLCTLGFSLGVLVPIVALLVFVGAELTNIFPQIQLSISQTQFFSADWWEPIRHKLEQANLFEKVLEILSVFVKKIGTWITIWASRIPKSLMELFIFTLTLFYSLENSVNLSAFFKKLIPLSDKEFEDFHKATEAIFKGVIVGSLLSAISQGTLIFLGYSILGIPHAFLFGVLTAFLSVIPVVGTAPTGLGAVIYLLLEHRYPGAIFMLVIFTITGFVDNIIKPIVLKGAGELHPLLGLLGALGGLSLFGFIGLFLGPLIIALGVISLKIIAHKGRVSIATK